MSRRKFLKSVLAAGACSTVPFAAPVVSLRQATAAESVAPPARWTPSEGPNRPIGEGKGIRPGRVVWVHDPSVARWDGDPGSGGWYEDKATDPAVAERMLSQTLRLLTEAETDAAAWAGLFRHFNRTHGRGDVGYQPGEKIAIKLNLNCCKREADPKQGVFNTPQLTLALFRQLVRHAGVRDADIVVYDASRFASDALILPTRAELPGIRFGDRDGGDGRFRVEPNLGVALHFGDPTTPDNGKTYLPACVTEATYLINGALLKGHTLAGVTLLAKNHFGSVYRQITKSKDPHKGWNPSNMHDAILTPNRPMGSYNPMVDLMGHKDLGGKTVLYLIDAIYAAHNQGGVPEKWQSAPFNGHWTASVFASQDPVAIESVAVDFFAAEANAKYMIGAVDNYLHEAALAHRPPSKTRYAPEGRDAISESLGVHEHWNNAQKKQYSRNLGTGQGIELV